MLFGLFGCLLNGIENQPEAHYNQPNRFIQQFRVLSTVSVHFIIASSFGLATRLAVFTDLTMRLPVTFANLSSTATPSSFKFVRFYTRRYGIF